MTPNRLIPSVAGSRKELLTLFGAWRFSCLCTWGFQLGKSKTGSWSYWSSTIYPCLRALSFVLFERCRGWELKSHPRLASEFLRLTIHQSRLLASGQKQECAARAKQNDGSTDTGQSEVLQKNILGFRTSKLCFADFLVILKGCVTFKAGKRQAMVPVQCSNLCFEGIFRLMSFSLSLRAQLWTWVRPPEESSCLQTLACPHQGFGQGEQHPGRSSPSEGFVIQFWVLCEGPGNVLTSWNWYLVQWEMQVFPSQGASSSKWHLVEFLSFWVATLAEMFCSDRH